MAFTCTVDEKSHLGVAHVSGAVDIDQLLQIMQTLIEDPAWKPGFDVLWDGLRITELVVSKAELEQVAELSRKLTSRLGPGKTAFLVSEDKEQGITRMMNELAQIEGRERRVFATLAAAKVWLGTSDID